MAHSDLARRTSGRPITRPNARKAARRIQAELHALIDCGPLQHEGQHLEEAELKHDLEDFMRRLLFLYR